MIKGLAGKIASLSGWRRALVAFISGAIATLTQPPFDVFIAGFIAFPLLVWLMDGAVPDADKGPIKRFFPGWPHRLVVWLRLFRVRSLVDRVGPSGRCATVCLGHTTCRFRPSGVSCHFLRTGCDDRSAVLVRWYGAYFRCRTWLRLHRMAANLCFHGFPVECIGLCRDADTNDDAIGGDYRSCCMSALAALVFSAPALLSGGKLAKTGMGLAALLLAAHIGFGFWVLSKRACTRHRPHNAFDPHCAAFHFAKPEVGQQRASRNF